MVGDESWMARKMQDWRQAVQCCDYAVALELEHGTLSWASRECRSVLDSRLTSLHNLQVPSSGHRTKHVECAAGWIGREADASSVKGPVSVTPLLGPVAPKNNAAVSKDVASTRNTALPSI
jgi:hypothetical protein